MNRTNLIPQRRIELKRKRRLVRRWAIINITYTMLLVATGIGYFESQSISADRADLVSVKSELAKNNTVLNSLRKSAFALTAELGSSELSSKSPDWSILLAVLSNSLGDEVVLTRVDCSDDSSNTASQVIRFTGVPQRFRIAGIGRSQQSVTQFVLRVESLGLFSRVRLINTSSQSIDGHNSTSFGIVCEMPRTGRTQ